MLKTLSINNFKCFRKLCLEIGSLTLLSGLNGMGKSTVIQALLLLRQSYQQNLLKSKGINLIGELVKIGTARDALFEDTNNDTIRFQLLLQNSAKGDWEVTCEDLQSSLLKLLSSSHPENTIFKSSLFSNSFQYLEAERIGPRTSYELFDLAVRQQRQLGKNGEYSTYFLSLFGQEPLKIQKLAHPGEKSQKLRNQVEAWLNELFNSRIRLHTYEHPGMELVNLAYSFTREKQTLGKEFRPTNAGFGISFTLPIIVALLSSSPGTLLLLENPESHLHPRGQVGMGKLISIAAESGIQIILETHSDHLLNGIRIAVRDGIIPPEDVKIHFFERSIDSSESQVKSPCIDKNGRLDFWPDGFFDEWEKSLEHLI